MVRIFQGVFVIAWVKPMFKSSISRVDVAHSYEENSGAMFVVLFLKIWAPFVEILDLNVGFIPRKMLPYNR